MFSSSCDENLFFFLQYKHSIKTNTNFMYILKYTIECPDKIVCTFSKGDEQDDFIFPGTKSTR